jgi:hypothetical protein
MGADHLDVQNDAGFVIDGRVLLVSRLQSSVAGVRGHCRIGVGRADFLVLAALPTFSLDLYFRLGLDLVLALNLAAARLRHIAGTAWSTKRYLNIAITA